MYDGDILGVWTEIKIGVSTGKSIPHRLKFSSLSSHGCRRQEDSRSHWQTDVKFLNQMKYWECWECWDTAGEGRVVF